MYNREQLTKTLEQLMPGIDSSGSSVIQSNSIIFKDSMAYTFNDSIAVRCPVPFDFEGAVDATKLLMALKNLDGTEIKVRIKKGKVVCSGKRRRASLALDTKIELPISLIKTPKRMRPLNEGACKAMALVANTAGKQEFMYTLTCVHITPEYIEACDNTQLIRYELETGIKGEVLIPQSSINILSRYNFTTAGKTKQWIHFQNDKGLMYSVRVHEDDYPDMSHFLEVEGEEITFPSEVGEAASRSSLFTESNDHSEVLMKLSKGSVKLESGDSTAFFLENLDIDYSGEDISFFIHPDTCSRLSKDAISTILGEGRIKVSAENYQYVAVLQKEEK